MNTSLRALAQKAKFRLRSLSTEGAKQEEEKSFSEACLSARIQYAIIAHEKRIEDDPLYAKVKKILQKDVDTQSPLSQLIEHNVFDKLSDREKEKYMYKLSKRYIEIREHILKEMTFADAI